MSQVDTLFVLILRFSFVSFVLLGIGVFALRFLRQPLERIRLTQTTLFLVFFVTAAGHLGWIPSTEIGWLPNESHAIDALEFRGDMEPEPAHSVSAITDENVISDSIAGLHSSNQSNSAVEITPNESGVADSPSIVRSRSLWSSAKAVFVAAFIGISLAQAAYFVFGYLATHRLVSSASPLRLTDSSLLDEFRNDTTDNRVRLKVSDKISVPIASGLLRPSIVIPQKLIEGAIDRLRIRHSLDHEWKHIKQRDLITWQLTSLAQIVLWPQPFYWAMRRELRVSQDQIADDFATRNNHEQVEYASTLVEFSKQRTCLLGALTMAGTKSNLYRRVEMLLNAKFRVSEKSRKRIVLGFAGIVSAVGVCLTSIHLTQAADPSDDADVKAKQSSGESPVAAKSAEHFGFVVDALNEKPVSNATVIVTRMRSDTWQEIEVTESTTDESGKFTFTIPAEQLQQKYLYIMFDLRHETYAPRHCGSYSYAMLQKNKKLGADPWFKKLAMVPGEKISGRFVDSKGNPVSGAAVRVRSRIDSVEGFAGQSYIDMNTDEDGRFVATVTAEGNASVSVVPVEQCMKHIDLGKKRGNLDDIVLSDGFSVSGVVLDALGKPMSGLWVNWRESEPDGPASYEARRSSKTDKEGRFSTRPIKPGKYTVAVQTKATGALEKLKYANFGDVPPPAVFVKQSFEVTVASKDKPFVIQAVPHIYISGQCYNPKGEFTRCHLPSLIGRLNGQWMDFRSTKGDRPGEFRILAPHGIKNSNLRFTTNEHTGLTIQFEGQEPSPQTDYRYETIEEDITNIKVVRYVAPIVQVKLVDEKGNSVEKADVMARYVNDDKNKKMMMNGISSAHFERQHNGVFRSSSLVPDTPFAIIVRSEQYETSETTMSMKEAATEEITVKLKTKASSNSGAAEAD